MFSLKNNFVIFTLICNLGFVPCLEEFPTEEYNDIATTEAKIRETANNLFAIFKIKDVGHKPRLKDFLTIHGFFVSITLKDCENLRKIVRLSRVYSFDNNTLYLITQINEVLNENDNSNEVTDDLHVNTLIELFVDKLRALKKKYIFNSNFANFSINTKIVDHFQSQRVSLPNTTSNFRDTIDTEDEIWKPTEASGRRIFHGHRTRISHFPFMASIQFFERFQCAGNIIKKDLVLTAASCLQLAWNNRFFRENPSFLSVQVGSDFYEASGENIPVMEIYFHPDYVPKKLHNNLALMRLITHILFSKSHRTVKRVVFDQSPSPLASNVNGIVIVGWGAKDRTNTVYDPWLSKLSFADLDFYPLLECQEVYSRDYVTRKNFCAGFYSRAGGACQHDVGGPGLVGGILVGVISFGPPTCGTPDAPTVFTKVGFYKDWINNIVKSPAPDIVRLTTLKENTRTVNFGPHYSDKTTKRFTIEPIMFDQTTTPSVKRFRGLDEQSLKMLEDDKLFKDFLSTMFEKEDEEFLGLSEIVNKINLEGSKKVSRKKTSTVSITPTTEVVPTIFDYSYENEDDESHLAEIKTVKAKTATTKTFKRNNNKTTLADNSYSPLLSSVEDEDTEYIEIEITDQAQDQSSINKKSHDKSVKLYDYNANKSTKNKKKRLRHTTEGIIRIPINVTRANIVNERPKMKAIEDDYESTQESDSKENSKLLDDDNLFEELLSAILESDKKKSNRSEDNIETDTSPIKAKKKSAKKLNSKASKSKSTTAITRRPVSDDIDYEDLSGKEDKDASGDKNKDASEAKDEKQIEYRAKTYTATGTDQDQSKDDSTLEKDIEDLLDDLDLRKLLESDETSSDRDMQKELLQQTTKKILPKAKKSSSSQDEYNEDHDDLDIGSSD